MKKTILILTGIALLSATTPKVAAGDREWATAGKILTGITAGLVLSRALEPAPVYYAPAPIVYAPPPPVYVAPPPPVVVYSRPVYVHGPPVYVAHPPVVVAPPPVYCPPRSVTVYVGHGRRHSHPPVYHHHHGHRHWR